MKKEVSGRLINSKIFPEDISIDSTKVFPMVVLATMTSGKSTLINAMLGTEILPNKNAACTSKKYLILDNDSIIKPKLYITTEDGYVSIVEDNLVKALEDANSMENVKDILISGKISGVMNTEKSLLIIDTPGPNNSQDESHEEITINVLNDIYEGLLVYVMNATQLGINDDARFLEKIKKYILENPKLKVVFVINKIDMLDFEKESVGELIKDIKEYIENHGFNNADIIPISALAASLFKKVLANEELTRNQFRNFVGFYDLFKPSDIRLKSFAVTEELKNQYDKVRVRGEEYVVSNIMAAIENTGINYLEKYIQEAQILSSNNNKVQINIK